MSTGRSFGRSSSVKVVACPSFSASAAGGGGERQPVSFPVSGDGGGGVDIGDLGRALGLDPSTVRLNGHYLSSGPDLVSSVSWASILSFFAARGFPFGASDSNPIVVQGKAITFSGLCCHCGEEDESYVSFKRKMELEDERTSKRTRTSECDSNTTSSDGHCIKRTLENGDGNPFKKMKINGCNRVVQNGRRSVKLVLCPSLFNVTSSRGLVVYCDGREGVNFGVIGRSLGLDPSTITLNRHFLSRGPDLVSSVVWDSLLSFFSSRGFPTGNFEHNPIVVQGKPLHTAGSQSPVFLDGDHPSLKRMLGGEDEIPSKRNRTECNAGKIEARDLLMRSSSLVDNGPLETPKTGESDSGDEFACGYNSGCRKRWRDFEVAVPGTSCKRLR